MVKSEGLIANNPHQVPYQTWEEYEKTLDKKNIKYLEVPSNLDFGAVIDKNSEVIKGGKLIIKDYPKLQYLDAHNCNLESFQISNCPELEQLLLNHNRLKDLIGLGKLTKLIKLEITSNNLKILVGLNKLKELKYLYCSHNSLSNLKLTQRNTLVALHCYNNRLNKLDLSGFCLLEDLNCSFNVSKNWIEGENCYQVGMEELNLDGCFRLSIVDAAENSLKDLNFNNLLNLEYVSLRNNAEYWLSEKQGLFYGYHRKKVSLKISSLKLSFLDTEDSNIIFEDKRKINILKGEDEETQLRDSPTRWEQYNYERKQRQALKDQSFHEGQTDISFNFILKGELTLVQGWNMIEGQLRYLPESTRLINLGNNFITHLTIKNFPNLERLIISHNMLTQPPTIINCSKYQALLVQEQAKLAPLNLVEQDHQRRVFYHYQHNNLPRIHWSEIKKYLSSKKVDAKEEVEEENDIIVTPHKAYWKKSLIGIGLLSLILLGCDLLRRKRNNLRTINFFTFKQRI